jgi:hypothetical protein
MKQVIKPLADLPNKLGFKFLGVKKDGSTAKCIVSRKESGVHFVGGGAVYSELQGWKTLDLKD